jgi:hypothetical protein
MARNVIDSAILLKRETVAGIDSVPTGVANALRVYDQSVEPFNAEYVTNEYLRAYAGGFSELVGYVLKKVSFKINLAGAGSAGAVPAFSDALRACALSEAISVGSRVEYAPVDSNEESATIYYYDSGVVYKLLYAKGDWEIVQPVGEKPYIALTYVGLDGGVVAVANTPATTLTAWRDPLVVTETNTGDLTIGCSYSLAALTGGAGYVSKGISWKSNNGIFHNKMLGGEAVAIDRKAITGSVELDLTAGQEVTMETAVRASTLQSFGLQHGSSAGSKIITFAPAVQMKTPRPVNSNGRRNIAYDLVAVPVSGNDEFRLVVA